MSVLDLSALDYEDLELFAEVHRLVAKAVMLAGAMPVVGSSAWWTAPALQRLVALLVVAEHHLLADPDRIVAQQLKAASVAISQGMDWSAATYRLVFDSRAKVLARRVELGPLAALSAVDPVAARRWVETGSSAEPAA